MELKKLIENIEKRPYMYLYNDDIRTLATFIDGYLMGKDYVELSDEEKEFRQNFSEFVQKYYDAPCNKSWGNTILYYEHYQSSLKKFFDLYKRWYEYNKISKLKTDKEGKDA